jgi:hypothetical protein
VYVSPSPTTAWSWWSFIRPQDEEPGEPGAPGTGDWIRDTTPSRSTQTAICQGYRDATEKSARLKSFPSLHLPYPHWREDYGPSGSLGMQMAGGEIGSVELRTAYVTA